MEVENQIEEVTAQPIEEVVDTKASKASNVTKWIKDEALATKTCEACGAVMRGWAFREKFAFCPMCGAKAQ